jgi:Flp pilus assembly protein TadG
MRLIVGPKRSKAKRSPARGVAAIELALVLPFLLLLSLGALDYGYYFWVGINATEAARAASMTASTQAALQHAGAGITVCGDLAVPGVITTAQTAANTYMTANTNATLGAAYVAGATYTSATVTCTTQAPVVGIVWKTVVTVDFPPPSRVMHFGLPVSGTNSQHIAFTTKPLYRK